MIKNIWKKRSLFNSILLILTLCYIIIIIIRKLIYKIGIFSTYKFHIPIVIVGNLTVGGNGKTPLVIWLVQQLLKRGYHVGVVSYGYKSKSKQYPLIIKNNISITDSGDEAALIYKKTGIPIAISPNRISAVKLLLQNYTLDIIIADDGLQHYSLKRDYEIVVIDGINRFGNGWLLPAGPLREFPNRLNTVDMIINNSGIKKNGEISMKLVGNIAINMLTGQKKYIKKFKQVIAIAGIGNPNSFFLKLKKESVKLFNTYSFSDHKNYKFSELTKLTKKKQILLMTEKDAIKCFHFAQKNWWYLPIQAKFSKIDTKQIINNIINLIKSKKT